MTDEMPAELIRLALASSTLLVGGPPREQPPTQDERTHRGNSAESLRSRELDQDPSVRESAPAFRLVARPVTANARLAGSSLALNEAGFAGIPHRVQKGRGSRGGGRGGGVASPEPIEHVFACGAPGLALPTAS
jgi:hypothetical protein